MLVKNPHEREPPAPTPLDEVMSQISLDFSPWIAARIKELRLQGRLVKGWTPPLMKMPSVTARKCPSENSS